MTVNDPGTGTTPPPTEGGTNGGDAPPSTPPVEPVAEVTTPPAPEATPKPLDAHSGEGSEIAKALNRQNEIFEAQTKSLKRIEEALYEDDGTNEPPPTGAPADAEVTVVTPDPPPQPTPSDPVVIDNSPPRKKWKSRW